MLLFLSLCSLIVVVYHLRTNNLFTYHLANTILGRDPTLYNPVLTRAEIDSYFPLSHALRKNYRAVLKEAQQVMGRSVQFDTFYESQNYLNKDKKWKTFVLKSFNNDLLENQKLCPLTTGLISRDRRIVSAMFSVLEPGKYIPPHQGVYRGIYKYHLGLDIPLGDCWISVDGQRYHWGNGKDMIFDGSYTHSVRNNTDKTRIILLLELKREEYGCRGDMAYTVVCFNKNTKPT